MPWFRVSIHTQIDRLPGASQAPGTAFIERLMQRKADRKPVSGPQVAEAQIAAFSDWEGFSGERFADLRNLRQPTLVVNGVHDEMIPIANSYWLSANLPNALLLTYPDSGHASLFPIPRFVYATGEWGEVTPRSGSSTVPVKNVNA